MFKEERKSLQFDWSHLGDIAWGRPNLGRQFTARETDCWCTGDRVCRFEVTPADT